MKANDQLDDFGRTPGSAPQAPNLGEFHLDNQGTNLVEFSMYQVKTS